MPLLKYDSIKKFVTRPDHPFAENLSKEIERLVMVDSYDDLDARRIAQTYKTRYEINQKITRFNGILGWLPLIPNLDKLAEQENSSIRLFSITTEKNQYLHFVSTDMRTIYGVLQFTKIYLDRNIELTEEGMLRGTWPNAIFYDNGVEVPKHNSNK